MKLADYKLILEEIVRKTLYENSQISEEDNAKLKEISDYLINSDSFIDDLRVVIGARNSENYYAYNKYISSFLADCDIKLKLDILNNRDNYNDIMNDVLYIKLWKSLKLEEKIQYLIDKKRFEDIDYSFINYSINEGRNFKVDKVLEEIINNDSLRNKIDCDSIEIGYSYNMLSLINLSDYDLCKIFTKESYTKLLLKKYKKFDEFKAIISSNKAISKLISRNGLIFANEDNEIIYKFLLKNHNFIGLFDSKYTNLFSILEVTKISEDPNLDENTFSTIIQKLYQYNKEKADTLFSIDNLKKCARHSITINPFSDVSKELREKIMNDYFLFSKFIDTIMIEAISDNYTEEEILNVLRNDTFIEDVSSYAIELLLNKLSFKASFNMLQRQIIFNKIKNLNVKVEEKDKVFFKGFLDSPVLLYKSEHSMVYEMLNMLSKEDVLYYITLPYVNNSISNYEIVSLIRNKDIEIMDIIDSEELLSKLNTTDVISIIDYSFKKNPDLNIFKDKKISMLVFDLNENTFNKINFDEVNYLYENIRMKSLLSKRESVPTILSYKAVIASYLVFGLDETLNIVVKGNADVSLEDVKKLQNEVVNERLLSFQENNSTIFENINKKITSNLNRIGYIESKNDLALQVRKNTFLDNLVYLVLDSDYDSYNGVIDKLYNYVRNSKKDEYKAKQEIYEYSKEFTCTYLNNKLNQYNKEFSDVILNNFIPKDNVLYSKRKEVGRNYLDKLKFKIFVKAISDKNKEEYQEYFIEGYDCNNLENDYKKYLAKTEVQFDSILNHVLIPIMNERFDKENCLNKLDIEKPEDTDRYLKYIEDLNNVRLINKRLNVYKKKYKKEDVLQIMKNICYNSEITCKLTNKKKQELKYLNSLVRNLTGELEINEFLLIFVYNAADVLDLYNLKEIQEYTKYLGILDSIVSKTKRFINKHIDESKIKNDYSHDYFKAVDNYNFIFPVTNRYYESKKHVLSLQDIEKVFNGYDLVDNNIDYQSLYDFLINKKNLIMLVDGYYDGIVDNLGLIISKWNRIKNYAKKLKIRDLSLIGAKKILDIIDNENNLIIKSLNRDIIDSIYKDGYYEVDVNKRINILTNLYRDSFKRISSSIPYLSYRNEQYRIEVLDSYNQEVFKAIDNSLYKVGAIGNDLLHYSILDKNGIQIGIYEDDVLTNKIIGIRNGNTLYLNILEGKCSIDHHELLRLFANEIINITKDSNERIDFVTIVNNSNYTSRTSTIIDSTICSTINNPIDYNSVDFSSFYKNDNLLHLNEFYTNYDDGIATLLASAKVVDKDSFKSYTPIDTYYRNRRNIIKLSNNIGEEYIAKINTILELCKLEDNSIDTSNINLNNMDTIFLGDDFVVFVTDNKEIKEYVLPYDSRAKDEVSNIKEMMEKN